MTYSSLPIPTPRIYHQPGSEQNLAGSRLGKFSPQAFPPSTHDFFDVRLMI